MLAGQGKQRRRHAFKRSKDYFETLAKAAEASNEKLVEKNIPLRFCVYEENGQVFIDVVRLDPNGKIANTIRKNITNEDFEMWIEDISRMEGLLFDAQA